MTTSERLAPMHVERPILVLRAHGTPSMQTFALYGVATKAYVQPVKCNPARLPKDFMFQLTADASACGHKL